MGQNPFENLWLEKKRKSIVDRRGYSSLLPVEPMNSFPGIFEYVAKNAVWVYQQSFGYDRWRGYIVCTTNTLSNREKKEENKHQKKKKTAPQKKAKTRHKILLASRLYSNTVVSKPQICLCFARSLALV